MAWGGLRGAVSLALVLIVTQTEGVPEVLGHQMLRLAGGVVFLTVVFHGTTTGRVLDWMGLGEGPPSEQAAVLIVRKVVLEGVLAGLDTLAAAPSLRAVHWAAFRDRVKARIAALERTLEGLDRGVAEGERMAARWKVALRMEREAYWHAFGKGLLSGDGLRRLDRELDVHDDRLRVDPTWIPERRAPRIQHRSRVRRWLGLGPDARRLELGVHLDRAEAEMGPGVAQALRAQGDDELAAVYQGWGEEARARLERARVALPEVVRGIEERLAARAVLDLEREGLQHAAMDGALPESVAAGLAGEVEVRMKQLELEPLRAQLPETADLCRRLPLLEGLDEATLAAIAVATDEIALAEGEVLFEEGERGDALYVIARGALEVRSGDEVLTVLGAGDVVGEMALLSGQPRNATVRAKTGAVLGRVSRSRAAELLADPEVAERMWAHFGRHAADQHLRARVDDVVRRRWIRSHTPIRFEAGDALPAGAFLLLDGAVEGDGGRREAPAALADGPWRSVAAGRAFPLPA
jgi:CPA1 family monovalent cation:H+ antiporter